MIPPRLRRGDPIGKLVDYWNMLIDHLNEIRLVPGNGISVSRMPAGTIIKALGTGNTNAGTSVIQNSSGPFAVVVKNIGDEANSQMAAVLCNSANEKSETAGLLTVGSYRELIPVQNFSLISGTLFLDILYDDEKEKYICKFSLQKSLPETADEKRYIYRISEIQYNEETKSYTAHQIHPCGDIEVVGRWVK